MHAELDPATYGLTIWDLDREFLTGGLGRHRDDARSATCSRVLRDAYCRTIGIEYMHIQETDEQRWIQEQVEGVTFQMLELDEQRHILEPPQRGRGVRDVPRHQVRRPEAFGLEGAESAIPILDAILSAAADDGLDGVVLGMAHRGRLNVLANIVGKCYDQIFREFEGYVDPNSIQGSGDVKYHLGQTGKFVSRSGKDDQGRAGRQPAATSRRSTRWCVGMVRAQQDLIDRPGSYSVLPILIHGDAAFAGPGRRGRDASTCATSTATASAARSTSSSTTSSASPRRPSPPASSQYATDVAKMIQAPIFHVNGDDPEACVRVARLAFDVPAGVPQGRRDRHGLLPPPRPQRGRRPELHAAAHVQAHRGAPLGAQAVHRVARQARRHHPRGGRAGARRLPEPAAGGARRDPRRPPPPAAEGGPARRLRSACCPTSRPACPARRSTRIFDVADTGARGSRSTRSSPGSSRPAQAVPARTARSTGPRPRRSPSARCCSRAPTCGSPARTPGGARSASVTAGSSTTRPARVRCRWQHARPSQAQVLGLRLAAVRVRRARLRVRLLGRATRTPSCCGRRSSATS